MKRVLWSGVLLVVFLVPAFVALWLPAQENGNKQPQATVLLFDGGKEVKHWQINEKASVTRDNGMIWFLDSTTSRRVEIYGNATLVVEW